MQAIQLTKYGEPEESLGLAEIAEPNHPKPGQIVIRVEYAPINDNDMLLARGIYTIHPNLPSVVGNEGAGKVLAVGDGVKNVKIGDRVMIPYGVFSWAEKVLAPAEKAIVLLLRSIPSRRRCSASIRWQRRCFSKTSSL